MAPDCCVPKCTEKGGYIFPKDKELKKKWRVAIRRADKQKRLWNPTKHSVVCRKHFKTSDFVEPKVTYGERRRKVLKTGVIPSVFPFKEEPSEISDRTKRYDLRNESSNTGLPTPGKNQLIKKQLMFKLAVFLRNAQ